MFQEQDVRAFCARNDLELVKVFRDEGYSGASLDRPGFQEMMEWARGKRFDVLVVWKLDRLFRDTKLTLQTVDELASLGIEFRSVQESFTHDSNGRFLLTIFAAGAEKERKDISLRMSAGRIASAKKGTWIAGGIVPYGYRYDELTKRLQIDRDEARIVKKLFAWLVEEKQSLYKIQSRLNELNVPTKFDRVGKKKPTGSRCWWAKRTIGRILTNEIYTGTFTFRKYRRADRVHSESNLRPQEDWIVIGTPAIISEKVFRKAQEQLKENTVRSPRRTKELYLLRSILVCGYDGRRMQAARRFSDQHRECKYYFCSGTRKGFAAVLCPSHSISESRLAPAVWEKLKELLLDPEAAFKRLTEYQLSQSGTAGHAEKAKTLKAKRVKVAERSGRLVELYLAQAIDREFFKADHRRLMGELDQIDRELKKLEEVATTRDETVARTRTVQGLYERYKDKLNSASREVKGEILSTFVKNVVVRDENLEIEVTLPRPTAFAGQSTHPLTLKTTLAPKKSDFAGQSTHRLSRKDTFSIFLKTRLIPMSQIFREAEIHGNFAGRDHMKTRRWRPSARL